MCDKNTKLTLNSPFTFAEIRFVEHDCGHWDVVAVENVDGLDHELVVLSGEDSLRDALVGASTVFLQFARRCDQMIDLFDEQVGSADEEDDVEETAEAKN